MLFMFEQTPLFLNVREKVAYSRVINRYRVPPFILFVLDVIYYSGTQKLDMSNFDKFDYWVFPMVARLSF